MDFYLLSFIWWTDTQVHICCVCIHRQLFVIDLKGETYLCNMSVLNKPKKKKRALVYYLSILPVWPLFHLRRKALETGHKYFFYFFYFFFKQMGFSVNVTKLGVNEYSWQQDGGHCNNELSIVKKEHVSQANLCVFNNLRTTKELYGRDE